MQSIRRSMAFLTLAALAAGPAAAEGPALYPPERPDQPPGAAVPRDDLFARSEGLRLSAGPYEIVQVNVDALGQNIVGDAANEPSIAVDPTNPDRIAIGWRQFDTIASSFRQGGWSFSTDGGQSWTFPGSLTPGTFRSDPVLDTDSQGNFYYQSLRGDLLMDVFKSVDGGATWGPPVASFGGDKNWMVVDKSGGIGDGHVYGIWREPFGCCGSDVFTRSTDGSASYETPVPVVRSPGLGTMAMGPDGEVFVTGVDEVGIGNAAFVAVRSLDARDASLSPSFVDADVDLGGSLAFGGPPNPGGLRGQANIAVDLGDGPGRGNVYLLSTVNPRPEFGNQPAAVHIARSEDGGVTWAEPVVVNDDLENPNNWHWMAAFAVAPNGRLDAIWNDTRANLNPRFSRLFYSWSTDEGRSWAPNVEVTPRFDSTVGWPNQNKIGDYYTIVSDLTGAHAAISATFNGEQDVYYLRLFPDCNENAISDVQEVLDGAPDCNANFVPDLCEAETGCGPAGAVPNAQGADGAPLLIAKTAGTALDLSWGSSCLENDADYAIYEGPVGGSFVDRDSRTCSTDGQTSFPIEPEAGDRYFLVVPQSANQEGSYGVDSGVAERPTAVESCKPQSLGVCPD